MFFGDVTVDHKRRCLLCPETGKSNFYSAAATTGLWRHLQSIHKLEREDAVQKWIVEDAARKKQQLLTALDEAERKKKSTTWLPTTSYIVHCERPQYSGQAVVQGHGWVVVATQRPLGGISNALMSSNSLFLRLFSTGPWSDSHD